MNKQQSYILTFFMAFIFFLGAFGMNAEAFSFNFHPISFFGRLSSLVVGRVSDILYYMSMQKKYVFEGYEDPNNIYIPLDTPVEVEEILARAKPPVVIDNNISNEPIFTTTSTVPKVENTKVITNTVLPNRQVTPATPFLVVKDISTPPITVVVPTPETRNPVNDSLILKYTNIERSNNLLSPLTANYALDRIASIRADDLFSNQYFEHDSPSGKSAPAVAEEVGYDYLLIGENLALGTFDGEQGIVSAWMQSPGHKANILNKGFTELGVAIKQDLFEGEMTTIAVQIFAKPLSTCPRPNPETKQLIDSSSVAIKKMQAEASLMFSNLNTIRDNPQIQRSYYIQKVDEYNYYAQQVNAAVLAVKVMVDNYNIQVSNYNLCIN